MYKLVVTELAHQDLDYIISYIAIKLSNPKAARDFLEAVTACYGFLKSNPMMYEQCRDRRLEQADYRKAIIKNYVLVYKVDDAAKTVNVMRFFYGAQDYTNLI